MSFFIQKPAGVLSVKALKCLQFLADKGVSNFSIQTDTISKLFHVVDDNNYSNKLQCGSLQILCKVLRLFLLFTFRFSLGCFTRTTFEKYFAFADLLLCGIESTLCQCGGAGYSNC